MSKVHSVSLDLVDASKLEVGQAKPFSKGTGKSARVLYDKSSFNLAIKNINFPFGASAKPEMYRQGDKDQWTLQCGLTDEQAAKVNLLDERIIDCCLRNPSVLSSLKLSANASRDILKEQYRSMLKESSGNYQSTVRVNLRNKGDEFECGFFRANGPNTPPNIAKVNNIPGDDDRINNFIKSGSTGSLLVNPSVWISPIGFGVTLTANQVKAR